MCIETVLWHTVYSIAAGHRPLSVRSGMLRMMDAVIATSPVTAVNYRSHNTCIL